MNSYTSSNTTNINAIHTSTSSLNTYTSSNNTRLGVIESTTASLNSYTTSTNSRLGSIETKTGSYATTGSNIFQGNQTITGSLYVSQDLIIAGSSSIQHISSSVVNIADNIITVNAQNPSIRFGGLAVIDSGSSPQVSGSMLFDSTNNQWIFVHQNQASVTSSVLLMGPQTYDNLGGETYPTTNRILKAINAEHVGDSNITDNGTKVSVNSSTDITGSLIVTGTVTSTNITSIESTTSSLNSFTSSINTTIKNKMNTDGVISGSAQVVSSLPAGTVSGSSQVLSGTGIWSGSAQLPSGVVSGSAQISFGGITGVPSGLVSGSSQITFASISSIPSGLVSGSAQISFGSISGVPSGLVSGSAQITLSSTTGFGSYLNQAVLTSSAPTFAGMTSSGPVTITGNGSYLGDWGYKTLELNDTSGYSGIFFRNSGNIWLLRRNGADNSFDFAYSTNATAQGTGTFTQQGKWTSGGDLYVRGQIYVGGNGSSTGTQVVYNSGTWGISISGNAATATTATTAGALTSMNISQFTNNSGYITGVTNISGYANNLYSQDVRTIAPNSHSAYRLNFGFTSWANNNTGDWADYLHLRSYSDSSGGADNLVMFKKNGIAMRIWQQTWNSSTAYASYKDVAFTDGTGASGTWGINVTGSAGTATYATNSTRLYASDGSYVYGGAAPYYMYMTYDGTRWLLQVSPATPANVRVAYSDVAASLSSMNISQFTNNSGYLTGSYVPTAGGTMTGRLFIDGQSSFSGTADSLYITTKRGGYYPLRVLANEGDYQGVLIEHTNGLGSGGPGPAGAYGFKFDDQRNNNYSSHTHAASFIVQRSGAYAQTDIFAVLNSSSDKGLAVATSGTVTMAKGLTVTGDLVVNGSWSVTNPSSYSESFTIQGTYPSMAFRSTTSTKMWLHHMQSDGALTWYHDGGGYNTENWAQKLQLMTNGTLYSQSTGDLGTSTYRWGNVYTNDLHLSNEGKEGGNDVDGTTGDWTIQEGHENLYIINNKNGKKFKIDLTEII